MQLSYKYFENDKCEYFPCHHTDNIEKFNCMFCYCPLYSYECGGAYKILKNNIKDCSNCLIPHYNYDYIIDKVKEIYENKNQ